MIKHAGPCSATVSVRQTSDGLELSVIDNGHLGIPPGTTGRGLRGMRERVALYHGHLETGAGVGGGYRVWARFPTTARAAG